MTTEHNATADFHDTDRHGTGASPAADSGLGPTRWPGARIAALATLAVIAVVAVALLLRLGKAADLQLLYGNLGSADATAIVKWLEDNRIRYRLDNGGADILVPADIRYQTRLDLAASGLPAEPGRGGARFAGRDYPGALEYELSRTIGSIDGVRSARVIIAVAGLADADGAGRRPAATIFIRREPGAAMRRDQTEAVVDLVAGAVEGIEPLDVTIVDSTGAVIVAGDDDATAGDGMLAFRQALEQRLERRAEHLLDAVLGPNRAIVRVNATIDRSRLEETTEFFDPDGQVIKRETTEEEAAPPRTVPPPVVEDGLDQSYLPPSRRLETIDYEIGRTTSTRVTPNGTVAKLSAVVLVAEQAISKPIGNGETPGQQVVADIVAAAVGLAPDRGDEIAVMALPFAGSDQAMPLPYPPGAVVADYLPLVKIVFIAIGLLAVYALLLRPLLTIVRDEYSARRRRDARGDDDDTAAPSPGRAQDDLEQTVRETVANNPAAAAYILKRWIRES